MKDESLITIKKIQMVKTQTYIRRL